MSFHWWFPVVLRTDVTEPCTSGPVTSPVTPPTHSWEVPSRSSWMMPSPSWHFSSWCSPLPTGLHICSLVALLLLQNTSPQVLVFCLVCSLLYPQLHEQHSLSRTGFSEDLLSELAAGTCFWPAPPNRKHCTSRGVPNTAAGLLDASALLVLSPMHQWQRTLNLEIHVPTLLGEFIHSW